MSDRQRGRQRAPGASVPAAWRFWGGGAGERCVRGWGAGQAWAGKDHAGMVKSVRWEGSEMSRTAARQHAIGRDGLEGDCEGAGGMDGWGEMN